MDPWVGEAQFLKNEMAVCLTRKEKKKQFAMTYGIGTRNLRKCLSLLVFRLKFLRFCFIYYKQFWLISFLGIIFNACIAFTLKITKFSWHLFIRTFQIYTALNWFLVLQIVLIKHLYVLI